MFAIDPLSKQVSQAPASNSQAEVQTEFEIVKCTYSCNVLVSYHSTVLVTIWVCRGLVRKECSYRPQTLKKPLPKAEALILVLQLPTRQSVQDGEAMLANTNPRGSVPKQLAIARRCDLSELRNV